MTTTYDELIDKTINDFCKNVDDQLALEHTLNEFSKSVIPHLLKKLNTNETHLAAVEDRKFALKLDGYKYPDKIVYKISIMDLEKFQRFVKLNAMNSYRPKAATFEYDSDYPLEGQLANALTLLLFDVFGLEIGAQDLNK